MESQDLATIAILENEDYRSIEAFCQHPDGSFLCLITNYISTEEKLHLVHYSSELEYIRHYDMDDLTGFYGIIICCTDTGDLLIGCKLELKLYRISHETYQRIKSSELPSHIHDLCTYNNKIYVHCDNSLVYVVTSKLKVKKSLELYRSSNDDLAMYYDNDICTSVVVCSAETFYIDIHSSIILDDTKQGQIRYKKTEGFRPQCMCSASEDSVFVLGKQDSENSRILQVNTEMDILSDILLEEKIDYGYTTIKMLFDRANARLVLHMPQYGDPDLKLIYLN